MPESYTVSPKTDHKAQGDYLAGKMIDGALVLEELFDSVLKDNSVHPGGIAKDLCSKYDITGNQKKNLGKIVSRVYKAQQIVKHLENKYGLTKKGYIKDKKGLYQLMFNRDPPKGHFSAKPFSFAIGFYLPENHFEKETMGYVNGWHFYSLDQISKCILRKIRRGKKSCGDLDPFYFCVNYKAHRRLEPRSAEEKLLSLIFGKNIKELRTERHELKHIIDKLIGLDKYQLTKEMSADLFDSYLKSNSLARDAGRLEEQMERYTEFYNKNLKNLKNLTSNTAKAVIQDFEEHGKEKINEMQKHIQRIKEFPENLIKNLSKKGMGAHTISYIIGETKLDNLEKRLRLLNDFLEKNPDYHDSFSENRKILGMTKLDKLEKKLGLVE